MIDLEFIQRAQKLLEKEVEEAQRLDVERRNKWAKENPEKFKKALKKYFNTPKGKATSSIATYKYRTKRNIEIDDEEREMIGKFYLNRPSGYVVDHIHPISKGGQHCVNNLQYLTPSENSRKKDITLEEFLSKITSIQMLELNQKEMRLFLHYLMSKQSARSSARQWEYSENVPKHILCESARFHLNKLECT